MSVLYVAEQGAVLRKKAGRLLISKSGMDLDEVLLTELEQVVVLGNVHLTSYVLRCLLKEGIDLAVLSASGGYVGKLSAGSSKNIDLRRAQFRRLDDPAEALILARAFVRGKLRNLRALIVRHQREHPQPELAKAAVAIRRSMERLDDASDVDQVRGLEGSGTAAYFGAFGRLLRAPGMVFERRLRRPPPDPVNVLLSFGYTLLGNLAQGYLELAGLDPFLGALHRPEYGRPSLALDLIEEFRPVIVDSSVVRAVNTLAITPRDFTRIEAEAPVEEEWERAELDAGSGGNQVGERRLVFGPAGVKKWITAYERRLNDRVRYAPSGEQLSYRQVIQEQVRRMARHLRGEASYEPFEWEA